MASRIIIIINIVLKGEEDRPAPAGSVRGEGVGRCGRGENTGMPPAPLQMPHLTYAHLPPLSPSSRQQPLYSSDPWPCSWSARALLLLNTKEDARKTLAPAACLLSAHSPESRDFHAGAPRGTKRDRVCECVHSGWISGGRRMMNLGWVNSERWYLGGRRTWAGLKKLGELRK